MKDRHLEENIIKTIDRAMHSDDYSNLKDDLQMYRAQKRQLGPEIEELKLQYASAQNSPQGPALKLALDSKLNDLQAANDKLSIYKDMGRQGLGVEPDEYKRKRAEKQGMVIGGLTGLGAGGLAGLGAGQSIFGESEEIQKEKDMTFVGRILEEASGNRRKPARTKNPNVNPGNPNKKINVIKKGNGAPIGPGINLTPEMEKRARGAVIPSITTSPVETNKTANPRSIINPQVGSKIDNILTPLGRSKQTPKIETQQPEPKIVRDSVNPNVNKKPQIGIEQAYDYAKPKVEQAYNYSQPKVKKLYDDTQKHTLGKAIGKNKGTAAGIAGVAGAGALGLGALNMMFGGDDEIEAPEIEVPSIEAPPITPTQAPSFLDQMPGGKVGAGVLGGLGAAGAGKLLYDKLRK